MQKPTINFIGAGKLGKTIAKLISINSVGKILGICNSKFESSQNAIAFIGEGTAYSSIDELPPADLTFITASDDKIKNLCEQLAQAKNFNASSIVLHCSGLLSSDLLSSAKNKGAKIASLHPMRSFSVPKISVQQFSGTYCALEGDPQAEFFLKLMFEKLDAKVITVSQQKKAVYHASAVIASNYLVALAHTAIQCLKQAEINEADTVNIVLNLMNGSLINLTTTQDPSKALTGPIQRGDVQTIKSHLTALEALDDNQMTKKLYSMLGETTLELTHHSEEKKKILLENLRCRA